MSGFDHISRRRFLVGAGAAVGAAILAACSSGATPTETPAPTKPAATTGSAPTTSAASPATTGTTAASAPALVASPSAATSASTPVANASVIAPTAPANVPKGGTLTRATVGTDAKSFHPYLTTDTLSSTFQDYIYGGGGLIKTDDNTLEMVGDVAEKFTLSADKKTYTFTLRDVKWSDGVPMTTDDYVWTYQQAIKPENKFPYLENITNSIDSFVATDPKTLVVTMKDAFVTGLIDAGQITPLPRHIWEKLDWSDPTKNPEINAPTVGNGPWKLKEWKRDDHATFVANDLYWQGRPNIDTLTNRIFGTQALAYQALKSGEVDYSGFQPSDYKEAKTLSNINVYEWYAANGNWSYIGFNLRRPTLKDPLVRKAIAYATDRKGIIDSVNYGLGRPLYSPFPQSSWAYNPSVEHYDFDVNKAQDLFKQAGYSLSGKNLTKGGQQLTLKMLYPSGSKTAEGIATVMQQQLSDLGIAINVQSLEFQALQDTLQKEPFDYDIYSGGWSATTEPYYMYQIWSAQSIPQLNAGAYVNKQVEDLFAQSHTEFDMAKRKAIFAQIQQLIVNDEPYVFLFESLAYAGYNKRVGGIPVGKFGPYDMYKWYLTK